MELEWFKKRGYRHFDSPVNEKFAAKVERPDFVARHSFSPLLHYNKVETQYKKDPETGVRKIKHKERPIKYASHRDACIFSYYSYKLNKLLDRHYESNGLSDCVLAYRALGRANYHFSAEAFKFAQANAPVTILAFDISGFFDNLDHALLKLRLKFILAVPSLPNDWLRVFRAITAFHYVDMAELKKSLVFAPRLKEKANRVIASVKELKENAIHFHPNPEIANGIKRGIPQGTPISATASNLYMIEFDAAARKYCDSIGALYRRYSDDILLICKPENADSAEDTILNLIKNEKLEISLHKTERTDFPVSPVGTKAAQYLGFKLHASGPTIRESSLARQWRKMRMAIKRTKKVAAQTIAAGKANKIYTKSLRRRFLSLKVRGEDGLRIIRNFSSYGRRSANEFEKGEIILKQVKRLERIASQEIAKLKNPS